MADIAVIFHWPPSEMNGMTLAELIGWRHRALQRSAVKTDEEQQTGAGVTKRVCHRASCDSQAEQSTDEAVSQAYRG